MAPRIGGRSPFPPPLPFPMGFVGRTTGPLKDDTFSISALHLAIKVPYFSNSGHKNEKVTTLTVHHAAAHRGTLASPCVRAPVPPPARTR
eukprot:SAG31_NODE_1405_length_8488_cov_2.786029_4_plen_90_part_00